MLRRSRSLLALATLLALTLAGASAIAEAGGKGPPAGLSEDDRERLEEREREETRRRERRRSDPRERGERLRSRSAYSDEGTDSAEALELIAETFGEQALEAVGDEPVAGRGERVVRFLSDQAALLSDEDGDRRIAESPLLPLRDGGGDAIDLDLEQRGEEFVPEDAAAAVELPEDLSKGLELEDGVRITPAAADDSDPEARKAGEGIAWPKLARDTDFLAVPTPVGAQLMAQLRSSESPEELELEVELPDGARLEEVEDGAAGARVVEDGKVIADISPPLTLDADGEEVPTELRVKDGERIVLDVEHRGGDYRAPYLLDPIVTSYSWYEGSDRSQPTAHWSAEASSYDRFKFSADEDDGICYRSPASAQDGTNPDCRGLYVLTKGKTRYSAGEYGLWRWSAPGQTSYLERVDFNSMALSHQGDNNARPDLYWGIVSGDGSRWIGVRNYPFGLWMSSDTVLPGQGVGAVDPRAGRRAYLMLYFDDPGWRDNPAHAFLGGARMHLSDPEPPTQPTLGHRDLPRWKSAGSATTTATASDRPRRLRLPPHHAAGRPARRARRAELRGHEAQPMPDAGLARLHLLGRRARRGRPRLRRHRARSAPCRGHERPRVEPRPVAGARRPQRTHDRAAERERGRGLPRPGRSAHAARQGDRRESRRPARRGQAAAAPRERRGRRRGPAEVPRDAHQSGVRVRLLPDDRGARARRRRPARGGQHGRGARDRLRRQRERAPRRDSPRPLGARGHDLRADAREPRALALPAHPARLLASRRGARRGLLRPARGCARDARARKRRGRSGRQAALPPPGAEHDLHGRLLPAALGPLPLLERRLPRGREPRARRGARPRRARQRGRHGGDGQARPHRPDARALGHAQGERGPPRGGRPDAHAHARRDARLRAHGRRPRPRPRQRALVPASGRDHRRRRPPAQDRRAEPTR